MFDFLKYQVIGLLTPEERAYNANLQARQSANNEYWRKRDAAVKRVWYIEQLQEWNFFDKSIIYTGNRITEEDIFDFKKYPTSENDILFLKTAYRIIYAELKKKLESKKFTELKIDYSLKKDKDLFKKKGETIYSIWTWFEDDGYSIQEIVDYMVEFKDSSYKEFLKKKHFGPRPYYKEEKFQKEYLPALYEAYDEQMKLASELKKSPLAKQVYEQNKLLKKQMGIEEDEPIFDFNSKKKKSE